MIIIAPPPGANLRTSASKIIGVRNAEARTIHHLHQTLKTYCTIPYLMDLFAAIAPLNTIKTSDLPASLMALQHYVQQGGRLALQNNLESGNSMISVSATIINEATGDDAPACEIDIGAVRIDELTVAWEFNDPVHLINLINRACADPKIEINDLDVWQFVKGTTVTMIRLRHLGRSMF